MKQQPLSIAEVVEIPPGEKDNPAWVGEFTGVVNSITGKQSKAGKKYWVCVIGDTTGSAEIEMSVFTAPKFGEGDAIEVTGQGMRRTEYNGRAQVALSQKSQVLKTGGSAHHEEQQQRKADSQPAVNGAAFTVNGQCVGHALTHAVNLLTEGFTRDERIGWLLNPRSWASVHEVASDMIRVARLLEAGKLAPSVKERTGGASAARPNTAPTDEQLANRDDSPEDTSVPF